MPETKKIYEIPVEDQTADFRPVLRRRMIRESSIVGLETDPKGDDRCYAFLSGGTVWKVLMSADDLADLVGFEIVRSSSTQ